MTWKDRALHAADAKATQENDTERLRKEAERLKQIDAFGWALTELLEEDISVDDLEVTLDGVTFRWRLEPIGRKWGVAVQGTCLQCGALAWSSHIDTLERLGKMLRDFYPEGDHAKEHLKQIKPQPYQRTTPIPGRNAQ